MRLPLTLHIDAITLEIHLAESSGGEDEPVLLPPGRQGVATLPGPLLTPSGEGGNFSYVHTSTTLPPLQAPEPPGSVPHG